MKEKSKIDINNGWQCFIKLKKNEERNEDIIKIKDSINNFLYAEPTNHNSKLNWFFFVCMICLISVDLRTIKFYEGNLCIGSINSGKWFVLIELSMLF